MFNCSFISKVTVIPNAFASIKYLFQVEHKIQDVVHLNDNSSKVTVIPNAFASVKYLFLILYKLNIKFKMLFI